MAIEQWRPRQALAGRLERLSPLAEMSRIDRQMQDLLDRFWQDFTGGRVVAPAVDMIDKKDEIVLRADLPGLDQKDVEVEIQDGTLVVRGQRQEEREEGEGNFYFAERWSGTFMRSVPLPPDVDKNQIKATFKNGVLEVHLPKSKEAKPKKVEIKS